MSAGPVGPLYLGIEIGGTKLQLGLGHADGRIIALERRLIRPGDGASGILRQVDDAFGALLARSEAGGRRPEAVGIGFGGPVDADRGVVVRSHQVDGWDGFDLAGKARAMLGVDRVAVQNDADTAGLGEAHFGAGVGLSPVFYVTIGSGIGGGLIVDGRIYRGSGAGAAEIGHLWIDRPDSPPTRLEDIASGWAIGRAAREILARGPTGGPLDRLDPATVDARGVALAASEGDPVARSILDRAAWAVGSALANVVTLLAPRRIILGGGVSLIGEGLWFEPVRSTLDARCFPPFRGTFDVVPARLGEEVVIHGALALAADMGVERGT